jgi:hypothetical protein
MVEHSQRFDRVPDGDLAVVDLDQMVAVSLLALGARFDEPVKIFADGRLKSVTTNWWCTSYVTGASEMSSSIEAPGSSLPSDGMCIAVPR